MVLYVYVLSTFVVHGIVNHSYAAVVVLEHQVVRTQREVAQRHPLQVEKALGEIVLHPLP